jgi:septin family protein
MELKLRLEILSKWLQKVTTDDFYYDAYRDGKLESAIAQAQVEVCNKIGSYLEEILEMDSDQIKDELK